MAEKAKGFIYNDGSRQREPFFFVAKHAKISDNSKIVRRLSNNCVTLQRN